MSGGSESFEALFRQRTVDRGVSQWNNNAAAVDLFIVNDTVPWS